MTRVSEFADWRPRILVTAPLRGEGLDRLKAMADLVYDPWIDQQPLRLYSSQQLAERLTAEDADALIVESDMVGPEVFRCPIRFVASTRGDPVNVDMAAANEAGVPVV